MPLEFIAPYMRGARFAAVAMRRRHGQHDSDLGPDAKRYIEMADRYAEAARMTFRLHRERERSG